MADYGNKLFDDPDGAVKDLKKEIIQEVSQLYVQAENTKAFWGQFYDANPDLKGARRTVEGVLQENLPRLANTPVPDAIQEIAKISRKELGQFRRGITVEPERPPARAPRGSDSEILQGGLDHGAPYQEAPAPEGSLTDTILARREQRRQNTAGVRLRREK